MTLAWTFPEFSPVGVDLGSADAVAHAEYAEQVQRMIDEFGRTDGEGFTRADFEAHVREEFSTYTWILEGLVERAGLTVEGSAFPRPTHGELVCRRR